MQCPSAYNFRSFRNVLFCVFATGSVRAIAGRFVADLVGRFELVDARVCIIQCILEWLADCSDCTLVTSSITVQTHRTRDS